MTKPFIAAACLAACALSSAHATVVQQAYSGHITGVASASGTAKVGDLPLQVGATITGALVYDNALLGSPASLLSPFGTTLTYTGNPVNNHITLSVDGQAIVAAPDSWLGACNGVLLTLDTCATPVVMYRRTGTGLLGQPTEILSLTYAPTPNSPFFTLGGNTSVRVASVTMDFFYPQALPDDGLPAQINFDALSFAQIQLNLSDGAGVFVKVMAINAPVPEAHALALMSLGLVGVAAVVRAQRRSKASATA
jgi:hypothetical protein